MLNFVICDDNKIVCEEINNLINKKMFKSEICYDIKKFYDYDEKFLDFIKCKRGNCIYILDIETPSNSGIDMGRLIREKDLESVIIFLTGHNELGDTILKDELYFLSFINKFDNYKKRLSRCLEKSLEILGHKKMLQIVDRKCIYTLSLNEILYFEKVKLSRKTVIVTNENKIVVGKTLKQIFGLLTPDFIYSSRISIVNKGRIKCINTLENKIYFDNGKTLNLISKKYLEDDVYAKLIC